MAELLSERGADRELAIIKAANKVRISKEWVLDTLVENVRRAMTAVPVMMKVDGELVPSGEYRYEGAVANKALELIGKELGMFIDRAKIEHTIRTPEQIEREQKARESLRTLLELRESEWHAVPKGGD